MGNSDWQMDGLRGDDRDLCGRHVWRGGGSGIFHRASEAAQHASWRAAGFFGMLTAADGNVRVWNKIFDTDKRCYRTGPARAGIYRRLDRANRRADRQYATGHRGDRGEPDDAERVGVAQGVVRNAIIAYANDAIQSVFKCFGAQWDHGGLRGGVLVDRDDVGALQFSRARFVVARRYRATLSRKFAAVVNGG